MQDKTVLIIGAGSIGMRHVKILHALGMKGLAAVDPAPRSPEALKGMGVSLYKTTAEGLKKEKPDIVFVCTPTHRHLKDAESALNGGAHVFIEKPLSHTLKGVDGLMRLAKQKKRVVMVACNYRFNTGFKRLKELVDSGVFGKSLTARAVIGFDLAQSRGVNYKNVYAAKRREGGGVILDSGAHAVDYMGELFGRIRSVSALYGTRSALGLDAEDFVSAILEYRSGTVVSLDLDFFSIPKRHSVEVQCERGWIRWDFAGDAIEWYDAKNQEIRREIVSRGSNAQEKRGEMFVSEAAHFLEAVQGKHPVLQDLVQAKETLKVLLAIKESGHKSQTIKP
jgi:predicted dehydrogenase